jgi:hypothetical protein
MLAWFDEPEWMLAQAIKSAAVIGTRLIAADGAYEQVTDKAPESPPEQRQAIEQAAEEAGLEVRFLKPRVWRGQVEKRNALLAAATEDRQERDWLMPLDADWVMHGIKEEIDLALGVNRVEQYKVRFRQTQNPKRHIKDAPHHWHYNYDGKTRLENLVYRAMDDMKLTNTHWDYSGLRKNGVRIGFSGGGRIWTPALTKDMPATFLIEHRVMFRDDKQLQRNKDFCRVRDKEKKLTGAER